MVDFAAMRANRGAKGLEQLAKELDKLNTGTTSKDDRFWRPVTDKAGNAAAVFRLLPAPGDEAAAFVRVWEHRFKNPNTQKWYVENSLTTIGQTDPVVEYNAALWNLSEDDKSPSRVQARLQKRKISYISNVYVIKDQNTPENEGKVFLYKYGKKIWDKFNAAMNPEFDDEKAVNPFDLWEGANFQLKITTGPKSEGGFRNYDKSKFATPGPLFADDDEMEKIWKRCHSLQQFLDPSQFKSYDELKEKFEKVIGLRGTGVPAAARAAAAAAAEEDDAPEPAARAESKQTRTAPPKSAPAADPSDDEDDLEFFKKLARGED